MPNFITRMVLQALISALPLFIVWIIGLVVAIIRWKKDPKKAVFTLLAILIVGFVLLLEIAWSIFGIRWMNTSRTGIRMARTLVIVVPLTINLLRAGGWILILLAIFSQPKKSRDEEPAAEVLSKEDNEEDEVTLTQEPQ
jgi:amino acid transporter